MRQPQRRPGFLICLHPRRHGELGEGVSKEIVKHVIVVERKEGDRDCVHSEPLADETRSPTSLTAVGAASTEFGAVFARRLAADGPNVSAQHSIALIHVKRCRQERGPLVYARPNGRAL